VGEASTPRRRGKTATVGLWVGGFVALAIGFAGVAKFFPAARWQGFFVNWGYPAWFALVVGAAEVGGAILVFVPRFAFYGAAFLAGIMVAAAITLELHRSVPPGWTPRTNLVYVTVLIVLAALRWRDRAWP